MRSQFYKFKQEAQYRLVSWLVWVIGSLLALTLRLRVSGSEDLEDRQRKGLPSIVVTWHGRTLIPVWYYGRRQWVAMISLSKDGEYQARIFRRFGYDIVRGSSGRGGVRALVGAIRKLRGGATVAFTPDGPRGPSHHVHPGVLYLSQKGGCPIYPLGFSAAPCRHLPTWDRYQVPLPFARAEIVIGEPLTVPPNAREEDYTDLGEELARRLCASEALAERMVTRLSAESSDAGGSP